MSCDYKSLHYLNSPLFAKKSAFLKHIEIWLWQHTICPLSLHAQRFLFQGEKGNLLPYFFKERKLQLYKNVTRNLFYRLERRLGFLKTVAWNYYTLNFASDPSFWESQWLLPKQNLFNCLSESFNKTYFSTKEISLLELNNYNTDLEIKK